MNGIPRRPGLATVACLWLLGSWCGCAGDSPQVGGETNWLRCDTDESCGELSCICGVCTTDCERGCESSAFDREAVCVARGDEAHAQACGADDGAAPQLCLPRCGATADCVDGERCVGGACVLAGTAPDDASTPEADGADAGAQGASGMQLDAAAAGPSTVTDGCDAPALDLLFVIDNSESMREEQLGLAAAMPELLRALTSGDLDGDGSADGPAVQDVQLGVVSSDMGAVGIDGVPGCQGLGDDGVLNDTPAADAEGCAQSYPSFLTFTPEADVVQTARDFGCMATLGTDGCGFEQPLEAALKALWPASGVDGGANISFLADVDGGAGQQGHGEDANAGLVREGSWLGVVFVTDDEDCSSADTSHFTPAPFLEPGDPRAAQPLGLRCFYNADRLHPVERYASAFEALRPEQRLLLAVIAGVPPELVDEGAREAVDFGSAAERDAYYQAILDDPMMQEELDPAQGDRLRPSCVGGSGPAYPPRRLVELARSVGERAVVQSICHPGADQTDLGPALRAIAAGVGTNLVPSCPTP